MKNSNEKYLPIGTVVKLKDAELPLMIIGFYCISDDNPNEVMDYNGCIYPQGVVSSEFSFLFNHSQIEEILFRGYENEAEVKFKQQLNEYLSNGTIDGAVPEEGDSLINDLLESSESSNSADSSDNSVNSDFFNII